MTVATAQGIQFLNLAYFGRPADPASLSAWPSSELSLEAIVLQFTGTAEYSTNTVEPNSALNPGGGRTFNDTNLINTFYQRLFGRLATSAEVAGWADALARGAVNYDYLGITILQAGLNLPAGTEMREVLIAKFDSNQFYTGILFNNPVDAAAYSTAAAIQAGIAFSSATTTTTPQTFAQAQTSVNQMVADSGASGGQTFTLTTAPDNVTGDFGTINGTYLQGAAANSTLNNFDVINTSNANARANINLLNTAATLNLTNVAALNGVKTVNLTNANGNQAVNGAIIPNATALTIASNGVAATGITGTAIGASLASFTLTGNTAAAQNNSITFSAGTRNAATDSFTINTSGNITATGAATGNYDLVGAAANEGIEIVNIVATGRNNWTRLQSQDLGGNNNLMTTVNISGAGSLTVGGNTAFAGTTGTINAATNTGGVDIGVGTSITTFTGGSGDDVLRFTAAGDFTSADVVNFGGGTNNVLALADVLVGASTTTALNSAINAVTSAQIVGLTGAATIDLSRITQNKVSLLSNVNYVTQNLAATDSITVSGLTVGTINATAGLGFNTFNLALLASADTTPTVAATGAITATNQAIINISTGSLGSVAVTNTIGAITNSTNATVTITGQAALTITSFSAAVAVSGSTMTRALSLTLADGVNSSATGGSANDTLVSGTGADTLIGGAGVDTFTVGVTAGNGARYQGGLGADLIGLGASAAGNNRTATLASTAADSFASTGNFDVVTFADHVNTALRTLTTETGVTSTSVAGATSVVLGTTAVAANGFLIVNASGLVTARNESAIAYQDSNGNGVIDSTDWATSFVIAGNDTLAFTLSGGQLAVAFAGAA